MKTSNAFDCNNCYHRNVCKHKIEFETYKNALYATVGSFRPYFNMPKLSCIDYIVVSLDCNHHMYDAYAKKENVKEVGNNEHDRK